MWAKKRNGLIYAALGGVLGWAVLFCYNNILHPGGGYYVSAALIGSIVAGFVAGKASSNGAWAGAGAALIGTVPALILILQWIQVVVGDFRTIGSIWPVIITACIVVGVLAFEVAAGYVCGAVGSWVALRVFPSAGMPSR